MVCNIDCYNCKFDDCIRDERQDENERIANWRKDNPEKVKAIRKEQYEKNKDRELVYQNEYYQIHKSDSDFINNRRENLKQWKAKNRDEVNRKAREYYRKRKALVI